MSFLWDTCVLSELGKTTREPKVVEYLDATPTEETFVSVISIGEIEYGLNRLPVGKRRSDLEAVMNRILSNLTSQVIGISPDIARLWGELSAQVRQRGFHLDATDGLIAATALYHGLHVVTRNVKDFEPTGVLIANPWESTDDRAG
jgi:predicted nucleic acid-binding protein